MRRRKTVVAGTALALSAAFLLVAPFLFKPYGIFILSTWAVMTIAAIGLNLTLGYAGQISLAQAAFVGIGAYITAYLTTKGWSFWPTWALAGVACFVTGWLLGYPALRLQHHYLGLRHAGLQHARLLALPQRGMAHRRHLRHQQRAAPEPCRLVAERRARVLLFLPRLIWRWCRSPPGG